MQFHRISSLRMLLFSSVTLLGLFVGHDALADHGALIERSEGKVRVLIETEWVGASHFNADTEVRYFWVEGWLGTQPGVSGGGLGVVDLDIRPASEVMQLSATERREHAEFVTTKFPIEIRRDVDLGLEGSVRVAGIGWKLDVESDSTDSGWISVFGQIAADVFGLRYANLGENRHHIGLHLADLDFAVGTALNFSENASLRLTILQANIGGSVGPASDPEQDTWVRRFDILQRVEFTLKTALGQFALYEQHGFRDINREFRTFIGLGIQYRN